MAQLKTEKDIKNLRKSGKILVHILNELKTQADMGIKLSDLEEKAKHLLQKNSAKSAFFGFKPTGASKGYPAHICTSVNEEIVHGLPRDYTLKNGDVLSIDLGVNYKGYITDCATTFGIGKISEETLKLIKTTKKALDAGLKQCKADNHTGDIGHAVEQVITKAGFKVIKQLTGHGVGFELHEEPTILNYGKRGSGVKLREGMVLAIEPMASMGSEQIITTKNESFATADGSLSAHFETTIAITKEGYEVLTPIHNQL